jgi:hypothetical protein
MKTVQIQSYSFDELSDKAKAKARDWWRNGALDYEWWESVYDDADTAGLKITSFDLDRHLHAKGEFISDACDCADKIIKNHGESCDTYKLAEAFQKERDSIVDSAPRNTDGELESERELGDKLDEREAEFLRAILEEYAHMLQKEYEYLLSDESADETIRANDYQFDEQGNRLRYA